MRKSTCSLAVAVNRKETVSTRLIAFKVLPDLVDDKPTANMMKQNRGNPVRQGF